MFYKKKEGSDTNENLWNLCLLAYKQRGIFKKFWDCFMSKQHVWILKMCSLSETFF